MTNGTHRDRHGLLLAALVLVLAVAAGGMDRDARASERSASGTTTVPRPAIVWKPIPFGARRRAEMAAYATRHYGIRSASLRPRMIVEHATASTTFSSAYWTFYADRPDAELGELPGICSHFVVDTDGAVYQLVRLDVMCRHTTGLNQVAIGIEHVGRTERDVFRNARQLRASIALTAWLADRFRIPLANVIGHNESLDHPLRYERYAAWRCQTHADFPRAAMDGYRKRLAPLFRRAGLSTAPTRWVDSGCR
jgi:N-acetylmuramoyl-L-alanine amidase-like protein